MSRMTLPRPRPIPQEEQLGGVGGVVAVSLGVATSSWREGGLLGSNGAELPCGVRSS